MSGASGKRLINNPYTKLEGYNCFGCSPGNDLGLQLHFYEEGEFVKSVWKPKPHFAGYKNILHGGIQATLLDEIASWAVQIKLKTAGVTANLDLRYRKPVFVDKGEITLQAKIEEFSKRIANVQVALINADGNICCDGIVKYFVYPEQIAREKLYYPEFEKFFIKD